METLLIIINHLIVFASLCLEITQCISYDIEEMNRNAVTISIVSGARHRANGGCLDISHRENDFSLSPDSRERSSNEEKKKRERERERERRKNDVYGREATVTRSTLLAGQRKLVGRVRPGN